MKSRRLAWLNCLGNDGKIKLPSSNIMESCPVWSGVWALAGVVSAGVCWPAGSIPPAESAGAESSWSAGSATPAESSSSAETASTAESSSPAGSAPTTKSSSSAGSAGLDESSSESAVSAGPVTPAESSSGAGRGGDWMTVIVLFSCASGTVVDNSTSLLDTWDDPASFSCVLWWCCSSRDLWSTVARYEEGRDLRSTDAFSWWWWLEEGRTSETFPKARVDPGWIRETTPCLGELDLSYKDECRVRSPLSWRLGEWQAMGESWRLSDPRWWRSWWLTLDHYVSGCDQIP